MQTSPRPHNQAIFLYYIDALSKKPQRTTYPHKYNSRSNQWVSSIGMPFRCNEPFTPTLVGWEPAA